MVSRALIASVLFAGAFVPATFAMQGDRAFHRQSAEVQFARPTWVAGDMLVGPYIIVHDEEKMMRGEPCTALYRLGSDMRPGEEVVSFRCIPRERRIVPGFTITVISDPAGSIDTCDFLTEYQFGGEAEGHGVPIGLTLVN
jgi:hypothetical protein